MLMVKKRRWLLAAAVLSLILAACMSTTGRQGPGTGTVAGSGSAGPGGLRAVRHVWVIELENQGYAQSFGTPSADPYLATTLPRTGALLENYYAIGHNSAANYIAQVSGQAPDIATQIDCPLWTPFPGQVIAGPYRQVLGEGCVYPEAVPTLGNQLSAAGRSWAAYLQDVGNDPGRDHTVATARGPACGHPATWAVDHTQKAEKGDQHAARHDRFTFFRSVTANPGRCAAHILSFRPLPGDLARAAATPAFSFIAPDLCNDGHDAPCVTGAPGGLADLTDPAERFVVGTRISGRLGWTHPDIAGFLTGAGLDALDIPGGLASRALRDIQAGQAKGRFTVPDPEIALSAVADGLLGLLRMCQRHPERVTETTVDQLAEAELRLLGVPAGEAARLTALPLPPNEAW